MELHIIAFDAKTVDEQIKKLVEAGYDVKDENIEVTIHCAQQ